MQRDLGSPPPKEFKAAYSSKPFCLYCSRVKLCFELGAVNGTLWVGEMARTGDIPKQHNELLRKRTNSWGPELPQFAKHAMASLKKADAIYGRHD